MKSFKEILKESNDPVEIHAKPYELPINDSNWFKDENAKKDMRQRMYDAQHFLDKTYGADNQIKSVTTSDGNEIFFTKKGKEEFITSIYYAFFENSRKAASKEVLDNAKFAKELLASVKNLDKIIASSKLTGINPISDKERERDRKKNVERYETYIAPVKINGNIHHAKIKVEFIKGVSKEGNPYEKKNYYYHVLTESESEAIPVIANFKFLD